MVRALYLSAAAALLFVAAPSAVVSRARTLSDTPPNIVVFYLDDVAPHDGSLWDDPSRTPALTDLFVTHGVRFANAIGETPLCCPGRSGFLTGLHTQNHGVRVNNVQLFLPGEHVGAALMRAGYTTMMIGKYMNHTDTLTDAQWVEHSAGWSQFDVYRDAEGPANRNNYTLFTKQGSVDYTYHRTRMIEERAVMRTSEADPAKPVFEVLSIGDLHSPNIPLPEFSGSPRCASMPPWKPDNYNEADVSDKPPAIQKLPLLPYPNGWPMVRFCEEMLGVDWLVQGVVDELKAEGRFDNTLFVFTADNGMAWGQHRLGQVKRLPYTTQLPLYMSWQAQWGSDPRKIDEGVSNIDLAPTFCEIGGCSLGPYPTGQLTPDGVSLLPLLDGSATDLGRDALLESAWGPGSWSAVRTTPENPLGLWHYVEYATGFRELYDLQADPWEMTNIASDPAYDDVKSALATRLHELLREGAAPRPNASIALVQTGPYKGAAMFSSVPTINQTQRRSRVVRGLSYDYFMRIDNNSDAAVSVAVQSQENGTGMTVQYLADTIDVTATVRNGTYTFDEPPQSSATLVVRILVAPNATYSARMAATVAFAPVGQPSLVDVVRAVASR